jgi:CRISPR-associated endonuclease Csn1
MAKILGIDLGTNSIGWAVVEKENGSEFNLIKKGVRIFQEGVKIDKGIESSKASERTEFRSARRNKYRRKLRKIEVLKALSEYGYCPELSKQELDDWRYKKIYPSNKAFREWQKTDEVSNKNPYYFRALAVGEKFDLSNENDRFRLGRAFYHMAQRRGFLSNRLDSTPENEKSTVKKTISEINKAKGDKTLGQYFFEKYERREKIRDTYTHREEHYLDEFKRICEFQNLPESFYKKLHNAIFYQRPLKSQKGSVGKCVFETSKPRCPISRPEFEEYRMMCFINNIKVKTPDDEKMRELTPDEKLNIRPAFFRKSKETFDFADIAKIIAPKNQYKFYKDRNKNTEDWLFNYPIRTTVSGCPVSARFKEIFSNEILSDDYLFLKDEKGLLSKRVIDAWHALFSFDSVDKLFEFAMKTLHLEEDKAITYSKIHLKQDYASLSLKAIRNIVPFLNEGLIYSHAVFLANMKSALPKGVWQNEDNQKIINTEIKQIIKTQREEKEIVEIVNDIIKKNRDEDAVWSEEAKPLLLKDIFEKIEKYYGAKKYAAFPNDKRDRIEKKAVMLFEENMKKNMGRGQFATISTIDERLKQFITDNFEIDEAKLSKLYHPSAIEVYKPAKKGEDGKTYLGSPIVSSIKNPMAMRALHQLRKVVNELIRNEIIDQNTRIHIEMARDLKNANERAAVQQWQNERERNRKEYAKKIKEHFEENNINREPNDDEILKYELWEEQNHICIYTGDSIGIDEFLGGNPKYDIEHTIPRSLSFDNSLANKTLCQNSFNRSIKRNKIPQELKNISEILERIDHWREKYENLDKQIQIQVKKAKNAFDKAQKDNAIQARHKLTLERDYWRNKYQRFTMKDVPEGFKNSQIVDTGIITKFSRLYLNTIFNKVYTVKGSTVADFRKMWGIQKEYIKKERINHIHHCIDAIVIACITKENYENLAHFYHNWEENNIAGIDSKPEVDKPWDTFTEDLKNVENEVLISHYTADVLPKQSKKILRKRGKKQYNKQGQPIYQQGDTARGSLHQQTFYGAIAHDKDGKVNLDSEVNIIPKYVVRKALDTLEDNSIKNIVDAKVKSIIETDRKTEKALKSEIEKLKKQITKADEQEEEIIKANIESIQNQIYQLYHLPNKNGKPIPIKKVRIYSNVTNPLHFDKKQRDKTNGKPKPYKEEFNVANDSNYLMAIYEGKDAKENTIRDFELINNIDAAAYFKLTSRKMLNPQGIKHLEGLIPQTKETKKVETKLKSLLKIGKMVILWEKTPDEVLNLNTEELSRRLYKIVGLSEQIIQRKYNYATIVMRHNKVAQSASDLKTYDGAFNTKEEYIAQRKMNHNQFNALVEGIDFNINPLGEIQWL